MTANSKERIRTADKQLPEDVTRGEVPEEVCFRHAVEAGIRAADQGEFATTNQIREAFASWDVESEG